MTDKEWEWAKKNGYEIKSLEEISEKDIAKSVQPGDWYYTGARKFSNKHHFTPEEIDKLKERHGLPKTDWDKWFKDHASLSDVEKADYSGFTNGLKTAGKGMLTAIASSAGFLTGNPLLGYDVGKSLFGDGGKEKSDKGEDGNKYSSIVSSIFKDVGVRPLNSIDELTDELIVEAGVGARFKIKGNDKNVIVVTKKSYDRAKKNVEDKEKQAQAEATATPQAPEAGTNPAPTKAATSKTAAAKDWKIPDTPQISAAVGKGKATTAQERQAQQQRAQQAGRFNSWVNDEAKLYYGIRRQALQNGMTADEAKRVATNVMWEMFNLGQGASEKALRGIEAKYKGQGIHSIVNDRSYHAVASSIKRAQ